MAGSRKRVTLIHNRKAGRARYSESELKALLSSAGYEVAYVDYKRCDLAAALDRRADLIAVAGGDGTIAKVAAHARPDGPPIAVLPLGTANNIAKSLGLDRPFADLVAGWSARRLRPFHLIEAAGPWGRRRLAEGLGFGALEQALADMPKDPSFGEARRVYAAAATAAAAEHLELRLDGEAIARPLVLLEVTTVPLVAANLPLAPAADPSTRKFAVCFVGDDRDERDALAQWLAEPGGAPAPVAVRAAEQVSIRGRFRRARLNGHCWERETGDEPDTPDTITLTSEPEPLPLLVPD
jgi:diacylglycerol kinase family enzyme